MTKPQCRKLSKPIFISELATEFMMNALRLKNGVQLITSRRELDALMKKLNKNY
ncbi:MAG: hypothetical protein CM15mP51_05200 [Porticoccaceae bacterium]|nr:MAG: hypothetical protein CM15mP51_05200 [Porticoccaceae bacterium]